MVFPVVMYGCKSWTIKKSECRKIDAFELWCWRRFLKSPLDCKEIQPVHPKGDQSWVFIGRPHVEAKTPILWPPHAKSWLIWQDPDAGKDWWPEEKGTTEDEMVGWHHQLNGRGFGWTPGVDDGQGGLACCNLWGHKESDTTEWLNWTEVILLFYDFLKEIITHLHLLCWYSCFPMEEILRRITCIKEDYIGGWAKWVKVVKKVQTSSY